MDRETVFITGATGLIGRDVLARLLSARPGLRAYALVRHPERWAATAASLGADAARVVPVRGDVRSPGLGLDPEVGRRLRREVGATLHLAADISFSRPLELARATNVEGTRNLLDLSADWRGPFALVSTAFVAGRRIGEVLEADEGGRSGWVNAYEQSKWEAEQVVRKSGRDAVILRSSTVVCDSTAGHVTQHNAVHRALRMLRSGLAPMLPGREPSPVDLVTAEYVADAVARLALDERAVGKTFHLCAGEGAIPLGEMVDLAFAVWSRDPAWRRRAVSRPVLTDLPTYRLFEDSVMMAADARLVQVTRALSHFAPQLALPKWFDTTGADAMLGRAAPPVREYWPRMLEHLVARERGVPMRSAA